MTVVPYVRTSIVVLRLCVDVANVLVRIGSPRSYIAKREVQKIGQHPESHRDYSHGAASLRLNYVTE